ncbi:MAG: hypothetical protein HQL47_05340 [Gammaproteobacteria bacterium]|nr:hypothetical protein [Gammaproteobacteria bacterium]
MSHKQKMGPETLIMMVALLFLLVLAVMAVTPDDRPASPGKGVALVDSSMPTGMVVGQVAVPPQQTQAFQSQAQGQTVAALQPALIRQTFPYKGVVDGFVNRDPGGWGQIHLLVNDGAGLMQDVSLAPEWYLTFQGCIIRRGQHVEGVGFHFDGLTQGGVLYAKNIIVNGVRCRLRTDEGLALWTDQLR